MKTQSIVLVVILALVAAFAALNWGVFIAPTELSLGITSVQMPLGVVMLGLLVLITVLFLAFVVYMQTASLLVIRRHTRELQSSRDLADKAEASRFTELRSLIQVEMLKQASLTAEVKAATVARVDQLATELNVSIEQSGNSLAAYIGELEDRLPNGTAASSRIAP